MANNRKSIYSALVANLLIALTKFIAGGFTNSASMISEGIHSTVDTTNQLLLLYGLKRSKKAPDESHPFGYGKELYFWSFVVSILIFALGGALSIYQGIKHMIEPEVMRDPLWNYIVLILSLIFEGSSLFIAVKEFNKTRQGLNWWDAIIKSKDPSSFLVVFEDGAAVAGLLVVMILMGMSHSLQIPELDGLASVIVGLILVFVSFILARESRSLLMGEGIAPETKQKIVELAESDPAVLKTKNILSTYQSPEEVVLMLIIDFEDHLDTEEITDAIQRIRAVIKQLFPLVRFVIIQPE
ncbi:cation diffusion facilitator family transporter [Epilithonimonas arachidiradicis]|uniref:Cation diffusion facilitator family transporter n=1 Tax=Epilithonimonas arachidiradicis TaxID=1617282 RepID=A0A420D917_9FLAO|nr:cation diffusion facilitator family transporter [Epilithonimonas arachidiradicis]RKE87271.1 cation diffusion facilitator family transporter [Epilithonimonas arachidiradicis]GGG59643.1 cation transporter [Epilithonimonas arachidiradicis]